MAAMLDITTSTTNSLIKPTLGEWRPVFRKKNVTISQLHIGHIRLMHSFILKQVEQSRCIICQNTVLNTFS